MNYEQFIQALISNKIGIKGRYRNRWFKASGDENALDYGAVYIMHDGIDFSIEDLSGRDDEGIYTCRYTNISFTDFLYDNLRYLSVIGEHKSNSYDAHFDLLVNLLDAVVAYGVCSGEVVKDTAYRAVLSCNHYVKRLPKDYLGY